MLRRMPPGLRPALIALVAAAACTTAGAAPATPTVPTTAAAQPASVPDVRPAPAIGTAMSATVLPLQAQGYVEQELFLHGQAGRYRIVHPLQDAQPIDTGHPYTTRVLVRRPVDAARFNGTVVVEWLNVSLDQDIDFVFGATHELLLRAGYAWVGVSAQRNGVEALKRWNPARYQALDVHASNVDPANGRPVDPPDPQIMAVGGDVLAWDIFSQVGRLAAASDVRLLGGLKARRLIAASESQSTLKVTTYHNSIQPLHRVYDGFLFYDRSGPLRTDLPAKSIAVGTEIYTALMGYAPQPDTDHQRWWEVNGASHFSLDEIAGYVDPMLQRDAAFRDPQGRALSLSERTRRQGPCTPDTIYSRVPNGDVLKAALSGLDRWIAGGPAPASPPRFVVDAQQRYVRDAAGRVQGGIVTAAQRAPRADNAGIGSGPWFCGPSGHHVDFTPAQLCQRYGSPAAYVAQVQAAVAANRRDGVLLAEEAQRTVDEAQALHFTCPAP